jgi:hypothetical protein
MTEPIEYVVCARQGGKRAAMKAKAAERHRCDEGCVCPADGLPMVYAPAHGLHACQDPDCDYAHPKETP